MRKIEDVIENIKYGNVLTISNYNSLKEDNNHACIIKYDGRILKDVSEVEIGSFLEQIPNIKSKISDSTYFQLKYDYESSLYQSSIMHKVRQGGYKEEAISQVSSDLLTQNYDLIDSILDLDAKIAQRKISKVVKCKKKELVS